MAPHEPLPDITAPDIDRCFQTHVFEKTFSAAGCIASVGETIYHRQIYGTLHQPPPLAKVRPGVLFDLSSLTVPLATGLAALYLVSRSRLDLGAPLTRTLPQFRGVAHFEDVTVDMLLDHTSGLPGRRALWEAVAEHDAKVPKHQQLMGTPQGITFAKERVAALRLQNDPGTVCEVSELNGLVLGWVIEEATGKPLDEFLLREIYRPLGLHEDLFFVRHPDKRAMVQLRRRSFAATAQCDWRDRLIQGEVNDRNAWALGGVCGHAGLFGTVDGVWRLVSKLWASYKGESRDFLGGTVRRFWTRSRRLRGLTRALAWDTPPAHGSPAGKRFSRNAVGALGEHGGSIWIDLSTDVIGVVLTNHAHPTLDEKDEAIAKFRPRVFELIAKEGETIGDKDRVTGAAAFYRGPGS